MSDDPPDDVVLGAAPGPVLRVLAHGATIDRLEITCGDGVRRNVVLDLPDIGARLASGDFIGGTIGRYANRIANGYFQLDGREVTLPVNDRGHHLHGGPEGFDRRRWTILEHDDTSTTLRLVSPDGDQGYPGELRARARFSVGADRVTLELSAVTLASTVVNLTTHAYFNLGDGDITDHTLQVAADDYTPVDGTSIPLGAHEPVAGTPFDLREPRRLGDAPDLDHNYVVVGAPAAVLESPATRTRLEVHTDQPGVQVYTGAFLVGRPRGGVALEPQLFPDSPNHPEWPSAVLRPGETYRSRIDWRFSATG